MARRSSTPQMVLPLALGDKASFANFYVGNNSELVAAIQSSVEHGEPKVVYFYGPNGAGKSHLMFAAARLARQAETKASYIRLDDEHADPNMLAVLDVARVVCIDNIHAWAGSDKRERALFTLFEQIRHAGGRLLISAEQPPESSGFIIKDLISRLSSELLYAVHELDDEQRIGAIKVRAEQRGLGISDETVKYLLSRSSRNTHELFAILDMIDQASLVEKRRITIPFLQSLIKS